MAETELIFDKQDQVDKVRSWLLSGERLLAVYDLKGVGSGFLGITEHDFRVGGGIVLLVLAVNDLIFSHEMKRLPGARVRRMACAEERQAAGKQWSKDEAVQFSGARNGSLKYWAPMSVHSETSFNSAGLNQPACVPPGANSEKKLTDPPALPARSDGATGTVENCGSPVTGSMPVCTSRSCSAPLTTSCSASVASNSR